MDSRPINKRNVHNLGVDVDIYEHVGQQLAILQVTQSTVSLTSKWHHLERLLYVCVVWFYFRRLWWIIRLVRADHCQGTPALSKKMKKSFPPFQYRTVIIGRMKISGIGGFSRLLPSLNVVAVSQAVRYVRTNKKFAFTCLILHLVMSLW